MINQPFYPQSPTLLSAVTSASTGGISPSTGGGMQAVRLVSISTGPIIFVSISQSATNTPVLPLSSVGSTATNAFPLLANQSETFKCPPNSFVSAISTAATMAAQLAITMGEGQK